MISLDPEKLKALRAGDVIEVKQRTRRVFRRGQTYSVMVDGEAKGRAVVAHATWEPGTKYTAKTKVWVLTLMLDRVEPDPLLAAKSGQGDMDDDGNRDYTTRPERSLKDAGASPPRSELADMTTKIRDQERGRVNLEKIRREHKRLEVRLGLARKVCEITGKDARSHLRRIERQLVELEKLAYDQGLSASDLGEAA